jgi:hypothetical protein
MIVGVKLTKSSKSLCGSNLAAFLLSSADVKEFRLTKFSVGYKIIYKLFSEFTFI